MTKVIDLKNEREGMGRRGLTKVTGGRNTWKICCWLLSGEEQVALLGGWAYLHDKKSAPSSFAGLTIGFEPAERQSAVNPGDVAIIFRADPRATGKGGGERVTEWFGVAV